MTAGFKKNVSIVFIGNLVYLLVTAAIYLMLFRWLDDSAYAVLIVFLALIDGLTEVSDIGLNSALIKSLGKYSSASRRRLSIAYVLRLKVVFVLFVFATVFVFKDVALQWMFPAQVSAASVYLLMVVAMASIFREFHFTVLLAQRRYRAYRNARILNRIIIIIMIGMLQLFGYLAVDTILIAFLVAAVLVSMNSYTEMFGYASYSIRGIPETVKQDIMSVSKWMSLSGIIVLLSSKLDVLFLSHYSLTAELAYYAIMFKLASMVLVFVRSLSQVYLSIQAARTGAAEMALCLSRKLTLFALVAGVVAWLLLDVGIAGIELATDRSIPAIAADVLLILIASFLISLVSSPLSQYVIAHELSQWLVLLNIFQLGLILLLNYKFIPIYGLYAPALAILLCSVVGYLVVLVLVWRDKRSRRIALLT